MSKVFDPKLNRVIGERVDGILTIYDKYKGLTSFEEKAPKEKTEKELLQEQCDSLGIKYTKRDSITKLKGYLEIEDNEQQCKSKNSAIEG